MYDERPFSRRIADRQIRMFAMFVGRGCHVTRAALEAASGISESTLRSWAEGAAIPLHGVLLLAQHLPAEAIDMLFEPAGMRLIEREKTETNWDDLAATASVFTADICDARADGVIDHEENARLRRGARHLAAKLSKVMWGD